MTHQATHEPVSVLYDGECPFCSAYFKMMRARAAAGDLVLINARDPSPLMEEVTALGHDLDEGIAVKINGQIYFGADALNILSLITTPSGVFNRLNFLFFRSGAFSQMIYPFLKGCRNTALWVKGAPLIRNLEKGAPQASEKE